MPSPASHRRCRAVLLPLLVLVPPVTPRASAGLLKINGLGEAGCVLLDFDSVVQSGHNGAYTAAGLIPAQPDAGSVCSNTWAVRGLTDGPPITRTQLGTSAGDAVFTQRYTRQQNQSPNDFTRGPSDGTLTSSNVGGLYGFDVDDSAAVDRAFGVRTGDGDFGDLAATNGAAGEIFFRVGNQTGETVTAWDVSFDVLTRNDTARGGELTFAYATPGQEGQTDPTLRNGVAPLVYETVAAAGVTLLETADALGWVRTTRTVRVLAEVANAEVFQLRWQLAELSGGSAGELGDAFALDNLKITAAAGVEPAPAPEPTTLALLGLAAAGFVVRRRSAAA